MARYSAALMVAMLLVLCPAWAEDIPLRLDSGVFTVEVSINGAAKDWFVVDTGSSTVQVSPAIVAGLVKDGTLTKVDYIGHAQVMLADGRILEVPLIRLQSVRIGGIELNDVEAMVGQPGCACLLGQEVLRRLSPFTMDFDANVLKATYTPGARMGGGRFTMDVPSNGVRKDEADGIVLRRDDDKAFIVVGAIDRNVPLTPQFRKDALQQFTQRFLSDLAGEGQYAVTKEEWVQLDGAVGWRVHYRMKVDAEIVQGHITMLSGSRQSYLLLCGSRNPAVDGEIWTIFKSFRRLSTAVGSR